MDDDELNRLLREWKAPDAPPGLGPPRAPGAWRRWLVRGTIRLPVPAAAAALVLAAAWMLYAQQGARLTPNLPGARPSGELARYPLTGPLEGYDAVIVEVNFAPGASAQDHRHPGPIVGYVVDGQMRFSINHEPDRIVPTGGTFFEPAGALHTTFGAGSADAPARTVAFLVVPRGSPVTARP